MEKLLLEGIATVANPYALAAVLIFPLTWLFFKALNIRILTPLSRQDTHTFITLVVKSARYIVWGILVIGALVALCYIYFDYQRNHSFYKLQPTKLHAIILTDTTSGEVSKMDHVKLRVFLQEITQQASMESLQLYYTAMVKDSVNKLVNDLNTESNDVVFFYYNGIGQGTVGNKWPTLLLKKNTTLPIKVVINQIKNLSARLKIMIIQTNNDTDSPTNDSKNEETNSINMVFEEPGFSKEQQYKNLFLYSKGMIVMASAKSGHYTYSDADTQTSFTGFFLKAFEQETENSTYKTSWTHLIKKTKINYETSKHKIQEGGNIKFYPVAEMAVLQ